MNDSQEKPALAAPGTGSPIVSRQLKTIAVTVLLSHSVAVITSWVTGGEDWCWLFLHVPLAIGAGLVLFDVTKVFRRSEDRAQYALAMTLLLLVGIPICFVSGIASVSVGTWFPDGKPQGRRHDTRQLLEPVR